MPQPYQYINQPNYSAIGSGLLGGFQAGQNIGLNRDLRSASEQARELGGQKIEMNDAKLAQLGVTKTLAAENADNIKRVGAEFQEMIKAKDLGRAKDFSRRNHEYLSESMKSELEGMSVEHKKNLFNNINAPNSLLQGGKIDDAKEKYESLLELYSGTPSLGRQAEAVQGIVDSFEKDPTGSTALILGDALQYGLDPDSTKKLMGTRKVSSEAASQKASTAAGAEGFAADLVEAQAVGLTQKNLLSKDQTKNLRADVLTDRNVIIKGMKKPLADFSRVQSLIDRIPTEEVGGVIKTNVTKLVDLFTGGTEEGKAWKQELESYKLVDMLKNKPPGALSEGELKVLQAGVPSENAGAEVIENYLKASKKALQYSYAYDKLNIKFLEKNNDQGTASRDMKIYGETIKAGETYDDFVNRLGKKMLKYGPKKSDGAKAVDDAKPKPMNRKDAANVLDF